MVFYIMGKSHWLYIKEFLNVINIWGIWGSNDIVLILKFICHTQGDVNILQPTRVVEIREDEDTTPPSQEIMAPRRSGRVIRPPISYRKDTGNKYYSNLYKWWWPFIVCRCDKRFWQGQIGRNHEPRYCVNLLHRLEMLNV